MMTDPRTTNPKARKKKTSNKSNQGTRKREEESDSYRDVRRKYLVLEEENFSLGTELRDIEGEVKALQEEKLALLDHLVVLEGLVNPSQLRLH